MGTPGEYLHVQADDHFTATVDKGDRTRVAAARSMQWTLHAKPDLCVAILISFFG